MSSRPRSTNHTFRIVLYVIIGLTCLKVWTQPATLTSTAYGQIPDSGNQRRLMIQELQATNALLQSIHSTLGSGTIKVSIVGADNSPAEKKTGKGR